MWSRHAETEGPLVYRRPQVLGPCPKLGNVVGRLRERSKSWLVVLYLCKCPNPNLGIARNIILPQSKPPFQGCFSRSFSPMLLPWTAHGEAVSQVGTRARTDGSLFSHPSHAPELTPSSLLCCSVVKGNCPLAQELGTGCQQPTLEESTPSLLCLKE